MSGKTTNWRRWSDIVEVRLPDILFVNIVNWSFGIISCSFWLNNKVGAYGERES